MSNNARHRPQVQWSEEERTELRRLRENGVTMKQIAKMMGRGTGSIEQQCKRLGLPKLPGAIHPASKPQTPSRVPPGASTLPPLQSLWDETPWSDLRERARLTLSRQQFAKWLARPDVIERMSRTDGDDAA